MTHGPHRLQARLARLRSSVQGAPAQSTEMVCGSEAQGPRVREALGDPVQTVDCLRQRVRQERLQKLQASIDSVLARHRGPSGACGSSAAPRNRFASSWAEVPNLTLGWWQPADVVGPPAPPSDGSMEPWGRPPPRGGTKGAEVTSAQPPPFRVVRTEFGPEHRHGRFRVDQATRVSSEVLAHVTLDDRLTHVDPRRLLFLDTETTGLARGAGTVAFLIGMAWFEDQTLQVEQLLLQELGQEAPMLERLRERVQWSSGLVTFNGKAYDWPLLCTRFTMQRVAPPGPKPHVDLLHCARRVYAARLKQTRLTELEDQVLGFRRERDIDGCEIPSLYWAFLRHRNPGQMGAVLEHNLHDVVSMSVLLHHLVHSYDRLQACEEPQDQLERARLAMRRKDMARAAAFAHMAWSGTEDRAIRHRAAWILAGCAKKAADWEGAATWLQDTLLHCDSAPDAADVHLALAKLCEHRLGHLKQALHHAQRAEGAEPSLDWARRMERLEQKQGRKRSSRDAASSRDATAWAELA